MKKAFAIILTFSVLFLCACNARKPAEEPAASESKSTTEFVPVRLTAPTTPTVPTTKPVIISEWPTDLLPEKFPAPPEGTFAFEVAKGDHEKHEGDFASDWVRIRFVCPEQNFHSFTNRMTELGYFGGSKRITDGTFYNNGYSGYWQNGKDIVIAKSSVANSNGEITVVVDVTPCADNFPDALTEIFPKFNGYTASTGEYCGFDASKNPVSGTFEGSFSEYWYWEYRFSNCFVGVSLEDFENYYETLGEMDFSGVISTATVDGCNTMSVDVTKTIGNNTYAVYMLFNQTLRTLDIAYTNDTSLYVAEQ
ncbi:MAG: hypothetical protein IJD49_05610 [Clostridia bacterium]|nr:hypothetical protein [Clostridia bacterium]